MTHTDLGRIPTDSLEVPTGLYITDVDISTSALHKGLFCSWIDDDQSCGVILTTFST